MILSLMSVHARRHGLPTTDSVSVSSIHLIHRMRCHMSYILVGCTGFTLHLYLKLVSERNM